ncbi:MAG: hypothetical protein AABY84_12370 [Candidatus Firestonebacteria bacterium]
MLNKFLQFFLEFVKPLGGLVFVIFALVIFNVTCAKQEEEKKIKIEFTMEDKENLEKTAGKEDKNKIVMLEKELEKLKQQQTTAKKEAKSDLEIEGLKQQIEEMKNEEKKIKIMHEKPIAKPQIVSEIPQSLQKREEDFLKTRTPKIFLEGKDFLVACTEKGTFEIKQSGESIITGSLIFFSDNNVMTAQYSGTTTYSREANNIVNFKGTIGAKEELRYNEKIANTNSGISYNLSYNIPVGIRGKNFGIALLFNKDEFDNLDVEFQPSGIKYISNEISDKKTIENVTSIVIGKGTDKGLMILLKEPQNTILAGKSGQGYSIIFPLIVEATKRQIMTSGEKPEFSFSLIKL